MFPQKHTQTSPSPGSLHLFRPGGPQGRRLPELPFRDSPLDSDWPKDGDFTPIHGSMADLPKRYGTRFQVNKWGISAQLALFGYQIVPGPCRGGSFEQNEMET